jgi:FAD/FMN-containing dehydrogenase
VKEFDWLTLVWAALVPAYSVVLALFPPKSGIAQVAYLAGSLLWGVVIFLLIKRQRSQIRSERAAELAELRQLIRDEYAEAARIRNAEAAIITPESVEPSDHLRELLRRERDLIGAYGVGAYGVGPYGGQDAWTVAAQNAANRQRQMVQQGDQESRPQEPRP